VEFPDIVALYEKLDLKPTGKCTLPVIHDPSTNKTISDSAAIARYLDETYPSTTPLLPPGSEALLNFVNRKTIVSLHSILCLKICRDLTPVGEEYYRRAREAQFGKKLEELSPVGPQREEDWMQVRECITAAATLLDGKKFVLGDTISFADVTIAALMLWLKRTLGAESQEWKDMEGWNDGIWPKYIGQFAEYEKIII
jgi:glutathione S-transferase